MHLVLFLCVKPGERPLSSLMRSLGGQVHSEEAHLARILNVRNDERAGGAKQFPTRYVLRRFYEKQ